MTHFRLECKYFLKLDLALQSIFNWFGLRCTSGGWLMLRYQYLQSITIRHVASYSVLQVLKWTSYTRKGLRKLENISFVFSLSEICARNWSHSYINYLILFIVKTSNIIGRKQASKEGSKQGMSTITNMLLRWSNFNSFCKILWKNPIKTKGWTQDFG